MLKNFIKKYILESEHTMCMGCACCSVVSDPLQPHGLQPARLLCPWGFSRQEYQSGLPRPPSGNLPNPGIKPRSPALQVILYQLSYQGSLTMCLCKFFFFLNPTVPYKKYDIISTFKLLHILLPSINIPSTLGTLLMFKNNLGFRLKESVGKYINNYHLLTGLW